MSRLHWSIRDEVGWVFTLVPSQFPLLGMILNSKCIDNQYSKSISLYGCHESVKATIDTPNIFEFHFNGYMNYSNFHAKVSNLRMAKIGIWNEGLSTVDCPWKHFPALRDFLKEFGCIQHLYILAHDFNIPQLHWWLVYIVSWFIVQPLFLFVFVVVDGVGSHLSRKFRKTFSPPILFHWMHILWT